MPSMKPYLKRPLPPVVRRKRAARVSAALMANPKTPAKLIAERDRFHRQVLSVKGRTGDYLVQFKAGSRRFPNRDLAETAMLAAIKRGDKPRLFLTVKLPNAGTVKGGECIWTYPSLLNTEGKKKMNANPGLAAQARPIVQEVLRMHGLSNKFRISKTSFSGFGYGDGYFVTIEGWKPDRELAMRVKVFILEKLSVIRLPSVDEDHWVVEFKGPGIVGNPRRNIGFVEPGAGEAVEELKVFEPRGGMIATDTYETGVNWPPFQYVEAYARRGKFGLIAFGAYNAFGLIGPEQGGVALVAEKPKKRVVGTLTIPYSRKKRLAMFKAIFGEINWPWAAKNAGFEMRYMPNRCIDPVSGAHRASPRRGPQAMPWRAGKAARQKCPTCGELFEGEGQCFRCQHPEVKRPEQNTRGYFKVIAHVPAKRRWEVVGQARSRKQAIEIANGLPTLSSGSGRTYSPYSDIIVKDVGSPKGTPFFGQIVFRLVREWDGKKEKWVNATPSYRGNPGGYTLEWSQGPGGTVVSRSFATDKALLEQLTRLREIGLAYTLYDSTGKVLETRRARTAKNPGPAYHRREAARYKKLLAGDLKAGHRDAADYWQGALSAEAASVAAGGVVRNPLTKKREEWQRRFTRLLMKKFGASTESLDLKKVFRLADKLYQEGFSASFAVEKVAFHKAGLGKVGGNPLTWFHVYLGNKLIDAIPVGGKMTVEEVRRGLVEHDGYDSRIRVVKTRVAVKKNWTGRHHAKQARVFTAAASYMDTKGEGGMARAYDAMAVAHEHSTKRAPKGLRLNPSDEERRLWVLNDEGLYNAQQESGLSTREFIKQNRALIDEVIANVTGHKKPAHYLAYGPRPNPLLMVVPNPRELSVPERHQLRVALQTLKMSPAMAGVMGGMTIAEAKAFLKRVGYSEAQVAKLAQNPRRSAMSRLHADDPKAKYTACLVAGGQPLYTSGLSLSKAVNLAKSAAAGGKGFVTDARGVVVWSGPKANPRKPAKGKKRKWGEVAKSLTIPALASIALRGAVSAGAGIGLKAAASAAGVAANPSSCDMGTLMKNPRFAQAVKLYRKFHGCDPKSVKRVLIPIGDKRRIDGREFFVSLGKAPSEAYDPPGHSGKAGSIFVHPYERKPEKVVSADGKTIVTLPGSHRVTDWIRG